MIMSGNRGWKTPQQTSLVSFFSNQDAIRPSCLPKKQILPKRHLKTAGATTQNQNYSNISKTASCSAFGVCPLCNKSVPNHRLTWHASQCLGPLAIRRNHADSEDPKSYDDETSESAAVIVHPVLESNQDSVDRQSISTVTNERVFICTEPVPGLFLYEDFITVAEEEQILLQLDDTVNGFGLSWKPATFNGTHYGQRWGVHCNLRNRQVYPAERPLPKFCQEIILSKLSTLSSGAKKSLQGFIPNEMNAIDYRKSLGHSLSAHVDDRHLSKDVIVNVSLAGDCYMTFTPINDRPRATSSSIHSASSSSAPVLVLLKRRCLQVLSGPARYQYTHGIANMHLHHERRVSLTFRESPITSQLSARKQSKQDPISPQPSNAHMTKSSTSISTWWKPAPFVTAVNRNNDLSSRETSSLPSGLFIFPNFITKEEEIMILENLDDPEANLPPWSIERITGHHREKRWGVDHDLWSRSVRPPKHNIPVWMQTILIQRFPTLTTHFVMVEKLRALLNLFHPNDVNAIDYRRSQGHSLASHVDDRQKHTELIANLSLAGDCYMTYSLDPKKKQLPKKRKKFKPNVPHPPGGGARDDVLLEKEEEDGDDDEYRVWLPSRTLQLLTGRSRYDYQHGISNADLCSERRVSLTFRETRP